MSGVETQTVPGAAVIASNHYDLPGLSLPLDVSRSRDPIESASQKALAKIGMTPPSLAVPPGEQRDKLSLLYVPYVTSLDVIICDTPVLDKLFAARQSQLAAAYTADKNHAGGGQQQHRLWQRLPVQQLEEQADRKCPTLT